MRHKIAITVLMFLLAAAESNAKAQADVDIERFHPALDPMGYIGIEGTRTPGHLNWRAGFWAHYAKRPLRVRVPAGTRVTILDHRLAGELNFQLGLGGRVALALQLPFIMLQKGSATALSTPAVDVEGAALGDPRLLTKIRIFGDPAVDGKDRLDGPGIALLLALPVPVGTEQHFASERQFRFDAQAIADFHLLGAGAAAMLGWRARFNPRLVGTARVDHELLYGVGLRMPIPVVPDFVALLEFRGATSFNSKSTHALEGDLGVGYTIAGVMLRLIVGTGIVRGVGSPVLRTAVGLSWAPLDRDIDKDGIPDERDECPSLAEDWDGFQDQDGCLDPDNDNDFIPDVDDRCPNEEALEGRDLDADGCTDEGESGEIAPDQAT